MSSQPPSRTPTRSSSSIFTLRAKPPIEGVTGQSLAQLIAETGKPAASYASSFADGVASVVEAAQPGDMILTLGAGSVSQLGPMILEKLRGKNA